MRIQILNQRCFPALAGTEYRYGRVFLHVLLDDRGYTSREHKQSICKKYGDFKCRF